LRRPPLADEQSTDGAWYRVFERGLVAVNPQRDRPARVPVGGPMPGHLFFDIFGAGSAAWTPYGNGYAVDFSTKHGGARSIACANTAGEPGTGLLQVIQMDQPEPRPIIVSGWSKAENVGGEADANYALYEIRPVLEMPCEMLADSGVLSGRALGVIPLLRALAIVLEMTLLFGWILTLPSALIMSLTGYYPRFLWAVTPFVPESHKKRRLRRVTCPACGVKMYMFEWEKGQCPTCEARFVNERKE